MRILFASTECAPWVKTGGLGDVSAALPTALRALGHDVRVLIPAYLQVGALLDRADVILPLPARGTWPAARLCRVATWPFELWLLDCPSLYARPGTPYVDEQGRDFEDNALRFGFLSRVAADLCAAETAWAPWRVDVLHANDWPTGLAPAYVSLLAAPRPATVFTIHNLAFQGSFDAAWATRLELPRPWLSVDGVLHWERISMLKAALRHADAITTVSPTYAQEIQSSEHGFGMDGMLRLRADSLQGILNGIDTDIWNPRTDRLIAAPYAAGQWQAKSLNKVALQDDMGLDDDAGLLFGMVSRLTSQKGIDLLLENIDWLVERGARVAVLGSGDAEIERRLRDAAQVHRRRIAVRIGFDERLAHLLEAGADCFLMPSRFEPCGLNQMYSLVYGTPPLVHRTGGLADTVSDADADPDGTGFLMQEATTAALRDAMARAMRSYADKPAWRRLQRRGMKQSFAWAASASRYAELYARLGSRNTASSPTEATG